MEKKNKNINILDCTLRDGGYYNNWQFSVKQVNSYLREINRSNIEFVEIGFRSLLKNKKIGLTGVSADSFFAKLKVPKNIKIGVMINSDEFLKKKKKN